MHQRKYFVILFLGLFAGLYLYFFQKEKKLSGLPAKTDLFILVDVQKLRKALLLDYIRHPSKWWATAEQNSLVKYVEDSGLEIPSYMQFFHLRDTPLTTWYTVLNIEDKDQLLTFLNKLKFSKIDDNTYYKDQYYLKIENGKCLFGTSSEAWKYLGDALLTGENKNVLHADKFIHGSLGSITYLTPEKAQNFSINVNSDDIEIKSDAAEFDFTKLLQKLNKEEAFLSVELDGDNLRRWAGFKPEIQFEATGLARVKGRANLEETVDTVRTYQFDENFNEVERKSLQKVIQANYKIDLHSVQRDKTWAYFQKNNWVNEDSRFIAIAFENVISASPNGFEVQTTRKKIPARPWNGENYIFIKNGPLLGTSVNFLQTVQKKILKHTDYVFYGNHQQDYYVQIKFDTSPWSLLRNL